MHPRPERYSGDYSMDTSGSPPTPRLVRLPFAFKWCSVCPGFSRVYLPERAPYDGWAGPVGRREFSLPLPLDGHASQRPHRTHAPRTNHENQLPFPARQWRPARSPREGDVLGNHRRKRAGPNQYEEHQAPMASQHQRHGQDADLVLVKDFKGQKLRFRDIAEGRVMHESDRPEESGQSEGTRGV